MSKETGFYLDTSDFDRGFDEITRVPGGRISFAAIDALYQVVGPEVLRLAIKEKPYAPHKTGHLWRSGRVVKPMVTPEGITLLVGFETPYAARLHEAIVNWNWTLAGSGPKYLESKIVNHRARLLKLVADTISKRGK